MTYRPTTLASITCLIIVIVCGCGSGSNQKNDKAEVVLGKLELSDGWARPASQGQNGAVYLTIANGTASNDTLLSVQSDAAQKAELHESYKNKNNTMAMRPVDKQPIPESEELFLEPGGLHIMLMNLKGDMTVGDSLSVSLEFGRVGTKTLRVPVRIQQ